jgi:2'-5' RNA ligase
MIAPEPEPPWRLFLALWPTHEVRAALAGHALQWHWPQAARRTAVERLHLTLHFLGDVAAAQVPQLQQALRLPWEGCALTLDAAEVWRGGIAVLEARVVPPALASLHQRLGDALRAQGIAVEERRLRPHLTLARRAQGALPPPAFEPLSWSVGPQYQLVRSLPGGRGYQPVQLFD